jgi:hypothetical protein
MDTVTQSSMAIAMAQKYDNRATSCKSAKSKTC